jgi:hypothetical protein
MHADKHDEANNHTFTTCHCIRAKITTITVTLHTAEDSDITLFWLNNQSLFTPLLFIMVHSLHLLLSSVHTYSTGTASNFQTSDHDLSVGQLPSNFEVWGLVKLGASSNIINKSVLIKTSKFTLKDFIVIWHGSMDVSNN